MSLFHVFKIAQMVPNRATHHKCVRVCETGGIQTLKRNNKKCGKKEVFHLLQESVEGEVTKEIFEERLDALVESHSVKIKLLVTRTCLFTKIKSRF